ncbi:MAG: fatty acid desaturase [Gammaproteobacteria bacterium]|nr:fatty acid desaturase [Gammaproteobacteria bacterium]
MDHRHFLSSLTADERLHLTRQTNTPGLLRIALNAIVIGLLIVGIVNRVPGWPLLCLLLGILLVFLFTLMHETTHDTVFTSKFANQLVAAFCGLVLILPPVWFRHFHLAHHRYTQDPERDPELASPKPDSLISYLIYLSGLPVWSSNFKALLRNASGRGDDWFIPSSLQPLVRREAVAMCLLYGGIITWSLISGTLLLLWVWVVPLILGQPFLRLFLLAEHGLCPVASDANLRNMFAATRTTLTNSAVRLLSWNMSYHTEHHVYPTVPFHRLPELHQRLARFLCNTSDGYARFHQEYRTGF